MSTSIRPNRSTAALTAASASTRLVTSSLTASRSFDCPKACDTRLLSRAVATTACPAAKAAFAKSTPIPRLAPVMNQTLLLLITTPWLSATVPANRACRTRAPLASRSASFDDTSLCLSVRLGIRRQGAQRLWPSRVRDRDLVTELRESPRECFTHLHERGVGAERVIVAACGHRRFNV